MIQLRSAAIAKAALATKIGVILGTLGRQGNTTILKVIKEKAREMGKEVLVLLISEIFPEHLERLEKSGDPSPFYLS